MNNNYLWTTICVLGILCFGLLLGIIALVFHRSTPQTGTHSGSEEKMCMGPECVIASAFLIEKMNLTVDPCRDMYQFACGQWVDNHGEGTSSIPSTVQAKLHLDIKKLVESKGTRFKSQNSKAIEKMKSFYRTCLDEEKMTDIGIKPILEVISSLVALARVQS